ncbi:MAG: AAA family ATPase [Anaeroplasma sp.]|nr:AAA family ATPase [Anaeroplasma sp.]
MELNSRAKNIMDLARRYSNEQGITTMGTEFLILAMFETEDSLCHFLLSEYEITRDEIFNKTNEVFILRKNKGQYNKELENILHQASLLSNDKLVAEEHIFMAILMNKKTIACEILENLGLDIDSLIMDVNEIYDFKGGSTDELNYVKNISKLAKNHELSRFIDRDEYINRIDIIMHRRYKNNPLLIGNAGVGKTALVEGYAMKLAKMGSDYTILSLNLTAMLAGTRYRGDFEEKFDKFVNEIASKKNVIVFIDEIHTIMGAATTEGNLDVANMLKPFLARGDIRVIGATTLDEYHKTIENDKALQRRFQPIFVNEPDLEQTKKIMFGIKEDYEAYHLVKISNDVLNYLIHESDRKITRKYRPDKCIDVLDDVLSWAEVNHKTFVTKDDVDNAILGISKKNEYNYDLFYSKLDKYRWLYQMDLLNQKPLLSIEYHGNKYGLQMLKLDISNIFMIGPEELLELDLSGYKEHNMITSIIGAPPGYIGYDDEGILAKHILEYPKSVIVLKNFKDSALSIQGFFINMILSGGFVDQKGRNIILDNTIFILEGLERKKLVGFNSNAKKAELFDDVIEYYDINNSLNNEYINTLSRYSYEMAFDFDIVEENKKMVDSYLYKLLKDQKKGKFLVTKEQIRNTEN